MKIIINWYNNLSIETLDEIENFYTEDCYFKDPFNEIHTRKELRLIFVKMFKSMKSPRFTITNTFSNQGEHVLFWDFTFIVFNKQHLIHGNTHLKLNQDNKIYYHCDYWDSVSELWIKTPILGFFIKSIYRILFKH
jgi:hypothetical protein